MGEILCVMLQTLLQNKIRCEARESRIVIPIGACREDKAAIDLPDFERKVRNCTVVSMCFFSGCSLMCHKL